MKPLFDINNIPKCKSRERVLPFECEVCGKIFYSSKHYLQNVLNPANERTLNCCSYKCVSQKSRLTTGAESRLINCAQCGKEIRRGVSVIKKFKNQFCSQSCAATYNNTHKTTGCRRSKLEAWLEQGLTRLYPDLEIHYNRKDAINSELDIYIPSLKLAFELNGIYHYEPIHGADKLNQIQSNDHRKFQACLECGIALCIIDTSSFSYFKLDRIVKYLDIIRGVIERHIQTGLPRAS